MKSLLALALAFGMTTAAMAAQPGPGGTIQPVPEGIIVQPGQVIGTLVDNTGIELFDCVEYRRLRNVHPCAVKKVVAVNDPCNPCGLVFVAICVPPCGCEDVVVHCHRNVVTFDYGKYRVRIAERTHGKLVVTYLD
ncbi:MAG TPA: hypothetical protein VNQ76_10925 [Planctomicrobium sp.]|nr:hypothetical protein [Planctomicrobium sp.]